MWFENLMSSDSYQLRRCDAPSWIHEFMNFIHLMYISERMDSIDLLKGIRLHRTYTIPHIPIPTDRTLQPRTFTFDENN